MVLLYGVYHENVCMKKLLSSSLVQDTWFSAMEPGFESRWEQYDKKNDRTF